MLGTESYSGNLDWELKSRAIDVSQKKYGARNFCFPLLPVSLSLSYDPLASTSKARVAVVVGGLCLCWGKRGEGGGEKLISYYFSFLVPSAGAAVRGTVCQISVAGGGQGGGKESESLSGGAGGEDLRRGNRRKLHHMS